MTALTKDDILQLIPHGPAMCLLDAVDGWDQNVINCHTGSSWKDDNPLMEGGELGVASLIEYGAQAAAIHSGLIMSASQEQDVNLEKPAYVAVVKEVEMSRSIVPDSVDVIACEAHLEMATEQGALYRVQLTGDGECLLTGQLVLARR